MEFKKYNLGDLIENFSVRARDYGGSEGLEFLGVSNDDGIVKSKSAAEHKGEEYKIIEKGCFAYNPYRVNIGSIAYMKEDTKGLISPAYVIFKTKPNSVKDNLLFKFLKSAEGLRQIRFHARGTVRQALRFEDLCKIELSIPTYYEQEKLISKIENIEVETKQISTEAIYQLDLVKQLRQSFLSEAMRGKLVKPNHVEGQETGQQLLEKIKAEKTKLIKSKKLKAGLASSQSLSLITNHIIPKNWCWCKADEILFITKLAGFEYSKYIKLSPQGDVPVIRAQNVRPFKIEKTNLLFIDRETSLLLNRCALTKKCLLVTFIGAGIGDISTFDESERWHLAPNVAKMEPFEGCEDLLNIKFLNYFLMSYNGQKEIFKHVKATAQPSLSMGTLRDIDLPLPSLKEQQEIVAKLEQLMAFCDNLEESIKESQNHNGMLLQQVLREALQPKEETVLDIDSLFEDKNYNLHVAMIQTLIESQLGINHGEVANQKTIFHINTFTNEKIPYQFVNHNFGTFSQQLRDDFNRNQYLTKATKNNKEVFIVKPSKQKEVLDSIYKPENRNFVNAVKAVLDIYELPFINKGTDKIELLNTVSKVIQDHQSSDIGVVYQGMKDWKINQGNLKCKADKFSMPETTKMIKLIQNKGLDKKLLK